MRTALRWRHDAAVPSPCNPCNPNRTLTRPCNPIGLPQALWLRPPGNVSDEEYSKFYKVELVGIGLLLCHLSVE